MTDFVCSKNVEKNASLDKGQSLQGSMHGSAGDMDEVSWMLVWNSLETSPIVWLHALCPHGFVGSNFDLKMSIWSLM